LIVLAILNGGILLYLTRYVMFYRDEWNLIANARGWDPGVFLKPHDQYPSTFPVLIWKLLFVAVGIRLSLIHI